jgi:uncharacterized protein YecA (UPF0149 family)
VVTIREEKAKLFSTKEALQNKTKRQPVYVGKKVPRNSPCPCGSGKKYRKCCGDAALKNLTYDDLSSSDSE